MRLSNARCFLALAMVLAFAGALPGTAAAQLPTTTTTPTLSTTTLPKISLDAAGRLSLPLDRMRADINDYLAPPQAEEMWKQLAADKRWLALVERCRTDGWVRTRDSRRHWGVRSVITEAGGAKVPSTIAMWDLEKAGSSQSAAILYVKKGTESYMAYFVFPAGSSDWETASEWYVDANARVQVAHSLRKCMARTLKSFCGPFCLTMLGACAAAAVPSSGPFSPATFLICLSVSCGSCAVIAMSYCGFAG